jgi:protein-S-isoprenylcysteine O-methyltransferase Ste14
MIERLLSAVSFAGLAYALPLVGSGALRHDFRPWLAIVSALLLVFAQPTLSKKEARATRAKDRGSAPLIMAASLGSQVVASLELRAGTSVSVTAVGSGVALVLLGSAIRLAAIRTLGAAFTASVRVEADHRLVQHGLYRWIRHPSYVGALLALLGVPVLFAAWWATALTFLTMSFAYARRIRLEEGALLARHGAAYRDYCARTALLIPGLW